MKIIRQYGDLMIKRQQEYLEYQRVHNEWKLSKTKWAWEKTVEQKEKLRMIEVEFYKVWSVLQEWGINRSSSKFWPEMYSEMKRSWNYQSDVFLPQQTKYLEYKYIPQIRQIFKGYIQHRAYILINEYDEPQEKKEVMWDALTHLPAVLNKNYLPLLIEVWMYYDVPCVTTREIIFNGIFVKNKTASIPAMRIRIKNRKKWESKDKSPYSDLIELEKKLQNE